ncbi:MAG: alpha/beta fold hydrolase BchO [Alphaproteobacteria bacterium]
MLFDFDRPDFAKDGRNWPNRAASRFIDAGGISWHVQEMGQGPLMLLIHGTGGATHSWRDMLPLLAARFHVVAPDLPGHGFTSAIPDSQMSLPGLARAVGSLMRSGELSPAIIIGHSAGAAIAIRAALDGLLHPTSIVGVNAALRPFRGLAQHLFPVAARVLALNPLVPRLFSWQADTAGVRRLVSSTGSNIDDIGLDCYRRLISKSGHAAAALAMMANWDLDLLERDLPKLKTRLDLIVSTGDKAVPPDDARLVQQRLPTTKIVTVPTLGHLAHEEDPKQMTAIIEKIAVEAGILSAAQT